ncbi:MAG: hypothetical protein P4L71_19520 [Acetobacteraceae bacterium]|nr:hypothetical protein [Acetobacteraceae bacterium]
MSDGRKGDVWTGPQLAARLLALKGAAPEAVQYVLYRETRRADGRLEAGYCVPLVQGRLAEPAFLAWLADQGLTGSDRLAVAVLVIRETLDEAGLLRECVLEQRRGGVDGPFCGEPARVEFTGPAQVVRLYRAQRNGRLQEVAASPEGAPPWPRVATPFAGEMAALRGHFGDAVEVLDLREPTLFEAMAGLSAIAYVRLPDGQETASAVGWFGTLAFVLEADFPRFGVRLDLAPADAAAVDRVLRDNRLVRHELRLDERGLSVMARRHGGLELFQIRVEDDGAVLTPYDPRPEAAAGQDQLRWMKYAETAETLAVLDAWGEGAGEELIVLTGDPKGQVWRHAIDADGVELWRRPDDAAAVGVLHRERLFPGGFLAAETAAPPASVAVRRTEPQAATIDPESLLGRVQAHGGVLAALHQVRSAAEAGDAAACDAALRALAAALAGIGAPVAARAVATLMRGADPTAALAALVEVEARLNDELAFVRLVPMATPAWIEADPDAPFGQAVADRFPSSAYDIDEAVRCLALRRSTAAMLHAMRIVQAGLEALSNLAGLEGPVPAWSAAVAGLRQAEDRHPGAAAALDTLRRRWRSPGWLPAAKYTEEEADQVLQALAAFMRIVATACDERGVAV